MDVRRHCVCPFSPVQSVKPEVQSVFKEKISQGDRLMGGNVETGRCRYSSSLFKNKPDCLSSQGRESTGGLGGLSEVTVRNNSQEVSD